MFDSINLAEVTYLASAAFLLFHTVRALYQSFFFAVELIVQQAKKARDANFNLKSMVSAFGQTIVQGVDVAAPLLVLAYGAGMLILNFGMLGFVPDLSFMESAGAEIFTVTTIWRALEAYIQHVQRKRDALKPAWKPQKKG